MTWELCAVVLVMACVAAIRIARRLAEWRTTDADATHAATLSRPPRRLASRCPDCQGLYAYEHPTGRRDARLLHAAFECTRITQRQNG